MMCFLLQLFKSFSSCSADARQDPAQGEKLRSAGGADLSIRTEQVPCQLTAINQIC